MRPSTYSKLFHSSVWSLCIIPQFDHGDGGGQIEDDVHPIHLPPSKGNRNKRCRETQILFCPRPTQLPTRIFQQDSVYVSKKNSKVMWENITHAERHPEVQCGGFVCLNGDSFLGLCQCPALDRKAKGSGS